MTLSRKYYTHAFTEINMDDIWNEDGGLKEEFATSFGKWVARNSGSLDEVTDSEIVCKFEQLGDQVGLTIGIHASTGRKQLKLKTLREEIELRMVTKYKIGEDRLVLQTGRGSRRFILDVPSEEWTIKKRPV